MGRKLIAGVIAFFLIAFTSLVFAEVIVGTIDHSLNITWDRWINKIPYGWAGDRIDVPESQR